MEKSEAYLSSTFYFPNTKVIRDRDVFVISLIAYDLLYVDQDLRNIPWATAKGMYLVQERSKLLLKYFRKWGISRKMEKEQPLNLSSANLALLMDADRKIYKRLSRYFVNIRKHPSKIVRNFFKLNFENALEKGGTPLFHPFILPLLDEYYTKELDFNWNAALDRQLMFILEQELFVSSFLAKKCNISPVLTLNDLEIRKALQRLPLISTDYETALNQLLPSDTKVRLRDKTPLLLEHFFDEETVQEIISFTPTNKYDEVKVLLEFAVPEFSNIPIGEIAKLKKRKRLKSISKLAEEIRENYSHIKSTDYAKIFVDYLWELGRDLSPSISEIAVGLLSEVPIPIPINPIGILSSLNDINQYAQFRKKYSWFITLSALKDVSRSNAG